MVIFRITTGFQTRYFEGASAMDCVRAARAAQVPLHLMELGKFFANTLPYMRQEQLRDFIRSVRD